MADRLYVGVASTPITPAPGRDMAGYAARTSPADGVLDDLTCRVVTLTRGDTTLAIVVFDLLYVTADLATAVSNGLSTALQVDPANVMVSATHTHCAPVLGGPDDDLVASLTSAAIATGERAWTHARGAELRRATFDVAEFVHNRRDPEGPLDPTGTVLVAVDDSGQVIGSLVAMACHPTVLEADTTAYCCDYPGEVRETVQRISGGTAVFLQGFAGDVNPVFYDHSIDDARLLGRQIGVRAAGAVLSVQRAGHDNRTINLSLDRELPVPLGLPTAVVSAEALSAAKIDVPVQTKPQRSRADLQASLAGARSAVADATAPDEHAAMTGIAQMWWIEDLMADQPGFLNVDHPAHDAATTLPVQAFLIGTRFAIVALPGEPMTASALRIRAEHGDDVLLVGYANRSASYLPTREEFTGHGYEVGSTRYEAGTVESLTDAALALVRRGSHDE